MKNTLLAIALLFCLTVNAQNNEVNNTSAPKFEVKIITSVESIVSSGLGRSRIISTNDVRDFKEFTSTQTKDDNSRNKSDRKDIRVKDFDETKLLNFYNIAGIRFQNIAANDAVISSKLTDMLAQGWDLAFVTSAVESDAGDGDNQGIFITRYIFKRKL